MPYSCTLYVIEFVVFEGFLERSVPFAVTISEAVDIAQAFGTEDSGRFVNGVLARVVEDQDGIDLGAVDAWTAGAAFRLWCGDRFARLVSSPVQYAWSTHHFLVHQGGRGATGNRFRKVELGVEPWMILMIAANVVLLELRDRKSVV